MKTWHAHTKYQSMAAVMVSNTSQSSGWVTTCILSKVPCARKVIVCVDVGSTRADSVPTVLTMDIRTVHQVKTTHKLCQAEPPTIGLDAS